MQQFLCIKVCCTGWYLIYDTPDCSFLLYYWFTSPRHMFKVDKCWSSSLSGSNGLNWGTYGGSDWKWKSQEIIYVSVHHLFYLTLTSPRTEMIGTSWFQTPIHREWDKNHCVNRVNHWTLRQHSFPPSLSIINYDKISLTLARSLCVIYVQRIRIESKLAVK